jgi:group I intron endonuclease
MPFIYKTTNIVNGKIYIGKAKYNNPLYVGSGLKIASAIKKYGKDKFIKVILEECTDSNVNDREIYWIKYTNSTNDNIGYNISKGGEGGAHYWATLTDEERKKHNKKISESRKGQSTGRRSDETKKKQAASFKKYADQNPDFFKKRGLLKCKNYICINHKDLTLFRTHNLKEFCIEHDIDFAAMRHNSRTRKTMCNGYWTCSFREFDHTIDDKAIISILLEEYITNKHKTNGNLQSNNT